MAEKRLEFPQISRIFNAPILGRGLKLYIIAFAAALLFIYILGGLPVAKRFLPPDFFTLEQAKLAVLVSPGDISAHLFLAQEYLKRGYLEGVERELLLAQELTEKAPETTSSGVLGATLSPIKILAKIKNEPQRIKNEISFWEKIVNEKPSYRDAYLQLAILNYQIYETEKVREYLKKAIELDPNYKPARELEKILGD